MKKILLMLLTLAFLAPAAYAGGTEGNCQQCCKLGFKASPWTEQTGWSKQALGKLEFGFKNFFAGWTEIFTEPVEAHQNKSCVIKGFLRGNFNALYDTIGGVLHIATFPITQVDVKLPEGGVSIGS